MPENTPNLGIPKPIGTEYFNRENLNQILDQIDKAVMEKIIPFGVTSNTGNAYVVTLNPAPSVYFNGMPISIAINADSTGASTLNVNGLGAKPLKKANGSDVTNLKTNGVYTFRYIASTGNFILQGEGGSGDAQPGDVLNGKNFSNDNGDQTGTLALTGDSTDANVLAGKTYYNTDAKTKLTGTMPNRSSVENALGTAQWPDGGLAVYFPAGYYNGSQGGGSEVKVSTAQLQAADGDFIAANIKSGINIFGLVGTLVEGRKEKSGQFSTGQVPSQGSVDITITTPFDPMFANTNYSGWSLVNGVAVSCNGDSPWWIITNVSKTSSSVTFTIKNVYNLSMNSTIDYWIFS